MSTIRIYCRLCKNAFFVHNGSDEFDPKFCCYCGKEFSGVTRMTPEELAEIEKEEDENGD